MKRSFDAKKLSELSSSLLLDEIGHRRIESTIIGFSAFILICFLAWASLTKIDEISMALGAVRPAETILAIQHPLGGQVEALFVEDGQYVSAGEVLLRFSAAEIQSELRQNEAQLQALTERRELLEQEYESRSELVNQGLNSRLSFLTLQGTQAELTGRIAELQEDTKRNRERLQDLEVRAPIAGRINNLAVPRRKAVIKSGEKILEIVPSGSTLVAEFEIQPTDIGYVHVGQPIVLKFLAYDFTIFGGVRTVLHGVSPTTVLNEEKKPFYKGYAKIPRPFVGSKKHPIISGMGFQADIITGKKSVLEYLLKPIFLSAQSALHER